MMDAVKPDNLINPVLLSANEDQSLVDCFLNGDQSGFSRLVSKYRKQAYAIAYRFTQNHEEADDLAQETFVTVFKNLHTFRGESSFKTWLLRITTNLSINTRKSGRVSKDSGAEPEDRSAGAEEPALSHLLEQERKAALRKAIARLPPKQRETLLLKTYRQHTCEEVAGIMGCSVGTVKANVFNALKRLKQILDTGE